MRKTRAELERERAILLSAVQESLYWQRFHDQADDDPLKMQLIDALKRVGEKEIEPR